VGGGQKGPSMEMDEFGSSNQNQIDTSAPLEQRIISKNWQLRAGAFDEIAQSFKIADSQYAETFKDHAPLWKKYLGDANPGSLEKCIDALNIFIEKADPKLVM